MGQAAGSAVGPAPPEFCVRSVWTLLLACRRLHIRKPARRSTHVSAYPVTPARTSAPRRPGTLTAALVVTVLTAITSIVNGILIATGGTDLIKDIMVDSGVPASMLTDDSLE